MKLRSETIRLKNQIKRPLEFNQATKQIEPLEYIYICTTAALPTTNTSSKLVEYKHLNFFVLDLLNTTRGNLILKVISLFTLEKQLITGL